MIKLTKNDIQNLPFYDKQEIINLYNEERNRLLKKFSKKEIGLIDDSFNRFPFASIVNGKPILNSNKLDREIYLSLLK